MIRASARGLGLAAVLAAGLALVGMPAGAQSLTLSPAQMRVLASESVVKGLPQQAYDLSQALLQRDPKDIDALLILSRAARDLGKLDEAQEAARTAWGIAETGPHRHAAAMAQAQALSSKGQRTRAQLWLRRAVHLAPGERERNLTIRDFKYVQARNRWSTQLRFDVSPSDNVNQGSTSETTQLFDLPIEFALSGLSVALPGTEIQTGIDTSFRLRETANAQTHAIFGLTHRTFILSDSAKEKAPGVKGSDLATTDATVGLRRSGRIENSNLTYNFGAEIGRTWYSGDPYLDVLRTKATLSYAPAPNALTSVTYAREWQRGHGTRDDSSSNLIQLSLTNAFRNGTQLHWAIGVTNSTSDADYLDYQRTTASARLILGKPVLGTHFSFGVSASNKHHDFSGLTGGERDETTLSADISMTFKEIEVLGFVPSVRVTTSRTDGNIDLFDKSETGVGFSIRSAF